jgi:hypothetical protein
VFGFKSFKRIFVVSLFLTSSYALAAKDPSCKQVMDECGKAGYVKAGGKSGKGLWIGCVCPLIAGTPEPKNNSLKLPDIKSVAQTCAGTPAGKKLIDRCQKGPKGKEAADSPETTAPPETK